MMILCIILAHIMTKNIIKPIEQMAVDLDDFSVIPAYKELEPFAATIRAQHTDILKVPECGRTLRQMCPMN